MLSLNSASKSGGISGKFISQPLREHELFGVPKSTAKKGLQPQLMKDLLGPIEWEKARQPVNNPRRTIMPDTLNHARRKLCTTGKHQTSPNTCGEKTRGDSYLSGLSKSEGKINAKGIERPRMQPENMKRLMESWQKEQVQRAAHSTKKLQVRNEKVRRKLYHHVAASPKPVAKPDPIARRSEMKSQKSSKVDAKIAPSATGASRRSRLVQPNSIRDKYVRQQDPITEESTLSIENASVNGPTVKNDQELESLDEKTERIDEKREENKNQQVENEPMENGHKMEQLPNSPILKVPTPIGKSARTKERTMRSVIVRPTVIMGVSAIELRKEQSPKSSETEQLNSNVLPKELTRNRSSRDEKLDAMDKPLDENPVNIPHCCCCASFRNNLPQNSFPKSPTPTQDPSVNVGSQSISWIHANLKQQVQSAEKQLSSLKLFLKIFEDSMKGHEEGSAQKTEPPTASHDSFAQPIDNSELNVIDKNVISEKASESSCEMPIATEDSKIRTEVCSPSPPEGTVNNQERSSLPQNIDDQDKENKVNVEKPRRRSARLAARCSQSPKSLTDSFSTIERELNIVHAEKTNSTPTQTKSGGKIDPRCRRSVREYMALKSSMNFLATPDIRGTQAAIEDKRTPSRVRSTRRDLSRKLLNELEDLYADSPV